MLAIVFLSNGDPALWAKSHRLRVANRAIFYFHVCGLFCGEVAPHMVVFNRATLVRAFTVSVGATCTVLRESGTIAALLFICVGHTITHAPTPQ